MTSLIEKITLALRPAIESRGYWLVQAKIQPPKISGLQVMCERQDGQPISMDDCATLSRAISAILDVEDLIPKAYILEVSSPGIERPLVSIDDFRRFAGREVQIELQSALVGPRRYRGTIRAVDDGTIHLDLRDEIVSIPYEHVKRANLTYQPPDAAKADATKKASKHQKV